VICLIVAGKLFHTRGPATAKLLSPRVVRVRGTASVLQEDERSEDTSEDTMPISLRRGEGLRSTECLL